MHSLRNVQRSLAVVLLALTTALPAAAARKPNIVLIFADDLGWKDTGYNGSDFYETPHLDRLAREGMVFTAGYAAAGNCAPSRACLISGQYTPRHGLYAVGDTDRGPKPLMRLVPIPNARALAAENLTVAEALKGAGYVTGCFGKWHLNGGRGTRPEDQGFDVVLEHNGKERLGPDPKGIYTLTRAACEFIEQHKDRPFFAYLSHHAVHTPHQARPESFARFQSKPPGQQHTDPLYAACTYDIDDSVGLVLGKLAELKLEDHTLVVFTSDNGGTPVSSQEPLRGAKGCYYEGGVREPFIVRWPGKVKPATTCDVPVINVDLYPTFLAAAGVDVPEGKTLDGESLVPLLTQAGGLRREAIFWHFPGYLNSPVPRGRDPVFRTRPVSVIRKGDWKLHLYHEEWQLDGGREKLATNRAVELYHLKNDIGERVDLALDNPRKRDELLDDLLAWYGRTGAKLPTERNPAYDPGKAARIDRRQGAQGAAR